MKKLSFALVALLLLSLVFSAAQSQTAMLGKSDIGVVRLTNLSGTPVDSLVLTGAASDFLYDIQVMSKTGIWSQVKFTDALKQTSKTYSVRDTSAVTTIISGFRIRFHSTLAVGNRSRIQYTHDVQVIADSTGALRQALWDVARTDSLKTLTSSARSILLNNDYPRGLTVIANVNMQFRTNRIENWIFLFAGGTIYIPIRHTAADTFYAKTATIPDVCILRGK